MLPIVIVISVLMLLLLGAFVFVRAMLVRTDPVAMRLAMENLEDDRPLGEMTESFAAQIKQSPKELSEVHRDLRRAGHYGKHAYADFQGSRVFSALVILIATVLLVLVVGTNERPLVFWIGGLGILIAGLAYALPRFALAAEGNRRVMRLENGLPDALDMMTMSIAGGLTLRQAMEHVAKEIRPAHPELGLELAIVGEQARLGTIQQAFRNFGERTDSIEIKSLAALVSDSEKLGTNVETTIRDHADSIRRSIRQRADERASKTNVRLIMPFALLLVPAMLLMLWAPPLLTLSSALERELQPGGALSRETLNNLTTDLNTDINNRRGRAVVVDPLERNLAPRNINGRPVPSRLDSVFPGRVAPGQTQGARQIR